MWIEAINLLLKKLAASDVHQHDVLAMSVSGQQHGLVSLDKEGNLSRKRSKLWNDFSTQEECDILTEKLGGLGNMVKEVSNSQRTGYTAAKIFHMYRHERQLYDNTTTFFLVHNYINYYLLSNSNRRIRYIHFKHTFSSRAYNHTDRGEFQNARAGTIANWQSILVRILPERIVSWDHSKNPFLKMIHS